MRIVYFFGDKLNSETVKEYLYVTEAQRCIARSHSASVAAMRQIWPLPAYKFIYEQYEPHACKLERVS